MRILLLADEPDVRLWDHLDRSLLEDIDLVISCGDLPSAYLSFITCFTKGPVLYVHGNHDASYEVKPPEGCICIEDGVFCFRGVRILGLGGSMRYKPGPYQYSEREMSRRVRRVRRQIRRAGGSTCGSRTRRCGISETLRTSATAALNRCARWSTRSSPAGTVTAMFTRITISVSGANAITALRRSSTPGPAASSRSSLQRIKGGTGSQRKGS